MIQYLNESIAQVWVEGITSLFPAGSFFLMFVVLLLLLIIFFRFNLPSFITLLGGGFLVTQYGDLFMLSSGVDTFFVGLLLLLAGIVFYALFRSVSK